MHIQVFYFSFLSIMIKFTEIYNFNIFHFHCIPIFVPQLGEVELQNLLLTLELYKMFIRKHGDMDKYSYLNSTKFYLLHKLLYKMRND